MDSESPSINISPEQPENSELGSGPQSPTLSDKIRQVGHPDSVLSYFAKKADQLRTRFGRQKLPDPIPEPASNPQPTSEDNQVDSFNTEEVAETPRVESRTYVGLEQLDQLAKDERFIESALEFRKGDKYLEEKFADIKAKREKILEDNSTPDERIEDLINADTEKRKSQSTDSHYPIYPADTAIGVARVIMYDRASKLPPTPEGYVRMYRGEGAPIASVEPDDPFAGKWFAMDLGITTGYPARPELGNRRLIFVDVPEKDLRSYHVDEKEEFRGASKAGEYHLSKEVIDRSQEFVRFVTADTQGDPWASKPSQNQQDNKTEIS